jgi:tetratricopeptide (TPR) repeat protein
MNSFEVRWVQNLFSTGDTDAHLSTTNENETTDVNADVVKTNLLPEPPVVGSVVVCIFGRGRVLEVRQEKQQVVVRLSSWRLGKASWVTCYLSMAAVQVVCDKKVDDMTVDEKVLYAQVIKEEGTRQFAAKDYEGALRTYTRAVENMRYVHEAPTEKALVDVVLLSITSSNNAATCCSLLEQWDEAASFARNALVLIESLEPKQNDNLHKRMFHARLSNLGYTDSKLFGEWRVKSLLTIAKAFAKNEKYQEALGTIKVARAVIDKYTAHEYIKQPALLGSIKHLRANEKQARKLKKVCKESLKANLKAEQKLQIDELYPSPATTPTGFDEDEDEETSESSSPQHFHFVSPETTRVLNQALSTLSPPVSSIVSPSSSVDSSESSDNCSVASVLLSSPPKEDKITGPTTSTKEVPPLADAVTAPSSWQLDAKTLAGIAVVTGGIGLTIFMGLASRGSK